MMSLIKLVTQAVIPETMPVSTTQPLVTPPQTIDVAALRQRVDTAIKSRQRCTMEAARDEIIVTKREATGNEAHRELFGLMAKINEAIVKLEINEAGIAIATANFGKLVAARRKLLAMRNDSIFSRHRETLSHAVNNLDAQMDTLNEKNVLCIVHNLGAMVQDLTSILADQRVHDQRKLLRAEGLLAHIGQVRTNLKNNNHLADAVDRLVRKDTSFTESLARIDDAIAGFDTIDLPRLRAKVAEANKTRADKSKRHKENKARKAEENRNRRNGSGTKSSKKKGK